jgi:hypothetical protein
MWLRNTLVCKDSIWLIMFGHDWLCFVLRSYSIGIGSEGLWPQLVHCTPFPSTALYFRVIYIAYPLDDYQVYLKVQYRESCLWLCDMVLSLGSTWHTLVGSLWVLSAAIPIWGTAFPCNVRHACTLPALEHPIVPAIQKHPSTVHQVL